MSLFDALLLDPAPFHIWISVRTDEQLGSGLITDPYDGRKVGSVYRFDLTMAKFSGTANVVVHLGPGIFPTQGYGGTTPAWQVHAGMKILGSGMGVTTIKLDVTSPQNGKHYFAVGHDLTKKVDAFEISDLTIDLNLAALADAGVTSAAGAVRAMGNHARIRRVNAVGWGSRLNTITCYVLSLIAGAPDSGDSSLWEMVNFGIEECYLSTAGASVNGAIVNLLNLGNQDDLADLPPVPPPNVKKETQAKSPFIRNCFVDGGVVTPDPVPTAGRAYVRAISMGWCRGGVVEGNQIYNVDVAGPFAGGATYERQLTVRDIIVRNNYAKSIARGLFLDLFRQGSTLVVAGTEGVGSDLGNALYRSWIKLFRG